MTDAEKLREAAMFLLRADNSNKEWADDLYRIADLLDAGSSETLVALKDGPQVCPRCEGSGMIVVKYDYVGVT